jgi:hypothetical protein
MTQTNIVMLVLAPLVLWRVYKRVQRLTVRQKSRMWRHWAGAVAFPLILAGFALSLLAKPLALAAIGAGVALGIVLGMVALRRTGFDSSGGEHYYTPYAPIGLFIAMLFIVRLLYRGVEFYMHGPAQTPDFGSSPLTMLIFATVAGYYHAYSTGLLRWRRSVTVK